MSEIPYYFDTPVPADFRRNGWFKSDNCLKFVTWGFSRCSKNEHEIAFDGQKILLKPFQFIFGRRICSTETNMSEMEVRIQQKHMEDAGFLKKATNKTPNRFTIYEWVTTSFSQINNQVKNQQTTNKQPTNNHNLDIRSKIRDHDHDLIDAREIAFDLVFEHKKHGKIGIDRESLICEMEDSLNTRKSIEIAIDQMIKQNPKLNGTIQAYLKSILRTNKEKKCKIPSIPNPPLKTSSQKNKGYYMNDDMSEAPLAKSARLNGYK